MQISRILNFLVAICIIMSAASAKSTPHQQIYTVYALLNSKQVESARNTNYEIAKNAPRDSTINVDIMTGNGVSNLYSTVANRSELQHLDPRLQQAIPSTDLALLASVKRILELAKTGEPLTAYIVHPGTSNPKTLAAIKQIAQEIATTKNKHLKMYLMGLLPDRKIATVSAFNPIAKQLGGSCTDDYSQCRAFIADLR